jgi:hypothetical protein
MMCMLIHDRSDQNWSTTPISKAWKYYKNIRLEEVVETDVSGHAGNSTITIVCRILRFT